MKTARLHELIEWANGGKKFEARSREGVPFINQALFHSAKVISWSTEAILATWEVKETPQVVEFEADFREKGQQQISELLKLKNKKWKFVCTEILEET